MAIITGDKEMDYQLSSQTDKNLHLQQLKGENEELKERLGNYEEEITECQKKINEQEELLLLSNKSVFNAELLKVLSSIDRSIKSLKLDCKTSKKKNDDEEEDIDEEEDGIDQD